jgi:hypothetical protein
MFENSKAIIFDGVVLVYYSGIDGYADPQEHFGSSCFFRFARDNDAIIVDRYVMRKKAWVKDTTERVDP